MDLFEQKPRTVYNIMQELDLVHEKWLKQNNSALVCVCVWASLKKNWYQFIAKRKILFENVQLCFRKYKLEKV